MDDRNDPANSQRKYRQLQTPNQCAWLLLRLGSCQYDSPNYYKWTQWIFTKLYEKGLAYEAEVPVNWVEELEHAIANEEFFQMEPLSVVAIQLSANQCANGCSKSPPMRSACSMTWMTLTGQSLSRTCNATGLGINWCQCHLQSKGTDKEFTVFTTRPDTLSVRPSLFWRLSMTCRCHHDT